MRKRAVGRPPAKNGGERGRRNAAVGAACPPAPPARWNRPRTPHSPTGARRALGEEGRGGRGVSFGEVVASNGASAGLAPRRPRRRRRRRPHSAVKPACARGALMPGGGWRGKGGGEGAGAPHSVSHRARAPPARAVALPAPPSSARPPFHTSSLGRDSESHGVRVRGECGGGREVVEMKKKCESRCAFFRSRLPIIITLRRPACPPPGKWPHFSGTRGNETKKK